MNGIIVIDKPQDYTSFDAVAIVRGIIGEKHLGHTGTLDPNATGVLPICIGNATRLIEYMEASSKEYVAKAKLGIETDSQDICGNIIKTSDVDPCITEDSIKALFPEFTGDIIQIPSKYSAIWINGKRAYHYAFNNENVKMPERHVTVYGIELLSFDPCDKSFEIKVSCGRGTYIRTIVNDIGQRLGCGACVTDLRRTACSGFTVKDSIKLEDLEKLGRDAAISLIKPIETALNDMPRTNISEEERLDFNNGKHVKNRQPKVELNEPVAVYCDTLLCGIGVYDNPNRLKPVKVFLDNK